MRMKTNIVVEGKPSLIFGSAEPTDPHNKYEISLTIIYNIWSSYYFFSVSSHFSDQLTSILTCFTKESDERSKEFTFNTSKLMK